MDKQPISRAGYDALLAEYKQLKEVEKPANLEMIRIAREQGDLSENADYSAAKEHEREINKRMQFLESRLKNANIIDVELLSGDRVMFGAHVLVEDENGGRMQCQILSDTEANGKTIIACTSPFGRAMIGRCVGDSCVVRTPSGEREYEIIEVEYK